MKAPRLNDSQLSMADPHQSASQVTPYIFQRSGARADLGNIDLMKSPMIAAAENAFEAIRNDPTREVESVIRSTKMYQGFC